MAENLVGPQISLRLLGIFLTLNLRKKVWVFRGWGNLGFPKQYHQNTPSGLDSRCFLIVANVSMDYVRPLSEHIRPCRVSRFSKFKTNNNERETIYNRSV